MRRVLGFAAAALTVASAAYAQDPHAGHGASSSDPHAGHHMPAAQVAPPPPVDPHAGHGGHGAAASALPPIPTDFDADRFFSKAQMDAARAQLAREHGRITWSKITFENLEFRPGSPDSYAWEGRATFGGDIDRLMVKSRGEGDRKLERAEVDVLWTRAISPWFNFEAGVRQDLQHEGRTYASVGVDGLSPYEFDVEAAVFLSSHGDLSARLEGAHDYRLTQRLILEPRAEVKLAASTVRSQLVGAGLSRAELGVRLRYAITSAFAPYLGVEHERSFGRTARLMRAAGEDPRDTRLVIGMRTWF